MVRMLLEEGADARQAGQDTGFALLLQVSLGTPTIGFVPFMAAFGCLARC